jgi:hypothetical protein
MKSALHFDMIPLLHDRGVSLAVIQSVVSEALVKEGESLKEILLDPVETRYWISAHAQGAEDQKRTDIDWDGARGLPYEHVEKAIYFLEHGFTPSDNPYLGEQLIKIAERHFSQALESESFPSNHTSSTVETGNSLVHLGTMALA